MTPTARAMSYEAARDVERCCIECYRSDCDCKASDQFPVIPTVTMYNDGPHDSMNAPSEEVLRDTPLQVERGSVYGPPETNLNGTGLQITGYLRNAWNMPELPVLTASQVCHIMSIVKINRLGRTPSHKDSYDDIHEYLKIAEDLA